VVHIVTTVLYRVTLSEAFHTSSEPWAPDCRGLFCESGKSPCGVLPRIALTPATYVTLIMQHLVEAPGIFGGGRLLTELPQSGTDWGLVTEYRQANCWNTRVQILTMIYSQGRFQILTAASMKMTIFWDVAPCSLVQIDRRFKGTYCLHHQVAFTFKMQNWTTSSHKQVIWAGPLQGSGGPWTKYDFGSPPPPCGRSTSRTHVVGAIGILLEVRWFWSTAGRMMLCSQGCLRPKWVATTESVDEGWR
jgi:hypothetical protein